MKALIWLACIAGVAYGGYQYAVSADCGKKGAVACPLLLPFVAFCPLFRGKFG